MKNVIKIIVSDIKRLSINVVAMVVIIGLTVIPCLYAWFNILSNWDPYGESATTNLQVAVASSDEGIMIGSVELNVGDIIISNLKENTTIGWVFTDTAQDAINGVYSGDYYAALVIDEQFSSNMISFLSGNIENPVITYYENDKKNAIAPKITAKVKTTIEREVDHAFVSTMAESLLKGGEYFATLDEEGNITGTGIAKLEQLDSDLNGMIAILDSYIALMDSTESISEAGEAITDMCGCRSLCPAVLAKDSQSTAANAKDDVEQSKKNVDRKVENLNEKLNSVDSDVNDLNNKIAGLSLDVDIDYEQMQKSVEKIQEIWGTDQDGLYQLLLNVNAPDTKEGEIAKNAITEYANVLNDLIAGLDEDVINLQSSTTKGEEDFNTAKNTLVNNIAGILACTKNIRDQYGSLSLVGQEAIDASSKAIEEVEKLINYNATSIDLVADNLDNYAVIMEQSKDSLVKSRDEAVEMESQLAALIAEIKAIGQNEAYQKIMELLQSDPDLLSDFISSPVDISDEYIYPVENNGSMTAPFYIILSIWVGSLIMSTILKTTVKDTTGMENLKNWQCFLGRYFTTFVIGQIQTIITVLGAFLFVGIQCEHPFYFWLACAWTSLIYSLLLYSFTYSFGNVGEALSVILMVIQVAGAGGTFPIEVLPKVFQVLYKFMPFNYSMNALRECIAGFYENTYRNCMLILIIYGVIAVFIGVTLYHPFKILNEKIENSKEKSGILI